jgi:hypothetical protein
MGVDLLEGLVDVRGVSHCCLVGNTSHGVGVDLFEDLVDVWGVCHCLVGNTSIGVDLLEDHVDVQGLNFVLIIILLILQEFCK